MKQFHSKLDKLYEGLHLKKTYIPETEKPDFKSIDTTAATLSGASTPALTHPVRSMCLRCNHSRMIVVC